MSCEHYKSRWYLYAADEVDRHERAALEAHLARGCPRCATELVQARANVAQLWLSIEQLEPPASIKQRLMGRVRAAKGPTPRHVPAAASVVTRRGALWPMAVNTAALLCVAFLLLAGQQWWRANVMASRLQALEHRLAQQRVAHLGGPTSLQALLASPQLTVVPLKGAADDGKVWGRLLWDRKHHVCYIFSSRLSRTTDGKRYHLWITTTDERVVMVGSFAVGSNNHRELTLSVPAEIDRLGAVAKASITYGRAGRGRLGSPLLSGRFPR